MRRSVPEPDPPRKILRGRFPPKRDSRSQFVVIGLKRLLHPEAPFDADAVAVGIALINRLTKNPRDPRYGTCYIGREKLAAESKAHSVKRVTAAIKQLCADDPDWKLFQLTRRHNSSNLYTFVVDPAAFLEAREAGQSGKAETDLLSQQVKGQNRLSITAGDSGKAEIDLSGRVEIDPLSRSKRSSERSLKSKGSLSHAVADAPAKRERVFTYAQKTTSEPDQQRVEKRTPEPPSVADVVALYHAHARSCPPVTEQTRRLEHAIRAAHQDGTDLLQLFQRAEHSDCLTGRADGVSWQGATLEWLLKNRRRVLAGEWDNKPARATDRPHTAAPMTSAARLRQHVFEVREREPAGRNVWDVCQHDPQCRSLSKHDARVASESAGQ